MSADDLDTLTKLEKGNRSGSAAAVASFSCRGGCKRRMLLEYFGQRRCNLCARKLPLMGLHTAQCGLTGHTAGVRVFAALRTCMLKKKRRAEPPPRAHLPHLFLLLLFSVVLQGCL